MKNNPIIRWLLFFVSIILMGLWFPMMFFRADEKPFLRDNFGLNTKLGHTEGDSVQEAFENIGKDGRWPHSLKNLLHEWTKENPKRAAKFLSFVILVQAVVIIILI